MLLKAKCSPDTCFPKFKTKGRLRNGDVTTIQTMGSPIGRTPRETSALKIGHIARAWGDTRVGENVPPVRLMIRPQDSPSLTRALQCQKEASALLLVVNDGNASDRSSGRSMRNAMRLSKNDDAVNAQIQALLSRKKRLNAFPHSDKNKETKIINNKKHYN